MSNYPVIRSSSHEPSYYGAGFGLKMAVNVTLDSGKTKITQFSSRMGYGASNYYGTRYEGPCTGTGALMRGAIWLNKPSAGSNPDFVSDNIEDIQSGGYLSGKPHGAIFGEFTWYFSNADCGKTSVWVGWIHDRYRDGKNTCVAFNTCSSGDGFTRLAENSGSMVSTSLRFGFTSLTAVSPYTAPSVGDLSVSPII